MKLSKSDAAATRCCTAEAADGGEEHQGLFSLVVCPEEIEEGAGGTRTCCSHSEHDEAAGNCASKFLWHWPHATITVCLHACVIKPPCFETSVAAVAVLAIGEHTQCRMSTCRIFIATNKEPATHIVRLACRFQQDSQKKTRREICIWRGRAPFRNSFRLCKPRIDFLALC